MKPVARRFQLSALALLGALGAAPAYAHSLSPAYLSIREHAAGAYAVMFRRPLGLRALTVGWPEDCREAASEPAVQEGSERVERLSLHCGRSLEGRTISVRGLPAAGTSTLVHATWRSGETVREVITPYQPDLTLPARSRGWQLLERYVWLGFEHLLLGFDHLLFVAGLVMLTQRLRTLVAVITMFTLGHSITLSLQALSVIVIAPNLAELGIALTLLLLAHHVLMGDRQAWKTKCFAAACGLIHGLGFAGALKQLGLPDHAVPLSLFGFNLGVELGQIALVTILAVLAAGAGKRLSHRALTFSRRAIGYGMGSVAAMWCIERSVG